MDDAVMDPWLLVDANGVDLLFGYNVSHPTLGGRAWAVSSPVVSLDRGRAVTQSGRRYRLGKEISLSQLPNDEALMAYRCLVDNIRDDDTVEWLGACKAARWLDLPPPSRLDRAAVQLFVKTHGTRYRALRAGNAK